MTTSGKLLLHVIFFLNICNTTFCKSLDINTLKTKNSILLNNQTFKKLGFDESQLPQENIEKFILEFFDRNIDDRFIYLGKAHYSPKSSIFLKLLNPTEESLKLTLRSENIKTDELNFFWITSDSLIRIYDIKRETPLEKRHYNNFDFAIPLELKKRDSLSIFITSKRAIGINEVSLELFEESKYKELYIKRLFGEVFLLVFGLVVSIVLTILGFIYKKPILWSIGIYLLTISLAFSTLFSFSDQFSFPSWTNLYAAKMPQFAPLTANCTCFLMLYFLSNQYSYKLKKALHLLFLFVFSLNLLNIILLLFTDSFHRYLTESFRLYTTLVILLCSFEILKFTLYTKRFYFLLALSVGLGLNIFDALVRVILNTDYPFLPLTNFTAAPFGILFLAAGGLNETRHELVTKQKAVKLVERAKSELENIRKEEIERIGRNLHDHVGNNLASALGFLSVKSTELNKVRSLLIEAINDLRFMSHNFVKDYNTSLKDNIESSVLQYDQFSKIDFSFHYYGNDALNRLKKHDQQNLLHIIQECLGNCVKHSFANEVSLQIFEDSNQIRVTIEDDGVGIKPGTSLSGIGLRNIKRRSELSKFYLNIDSTSNGVTVIIEIPI
ncbi:sensor histidine kinase [Jiulongibacter sp. NS-SX5]|uniref:sensor histidine kinase n=1 Tax=Jiulongibacter sp. NS-SX5 TaxID=3463854 RepID=UPI0040590E9A